MSKHYCLATSGQVAKSGNPNLPVFDMEDDDDSDVSDDEHEEEMRSREDLNALLVCSFPILLDIVTTRAGLNIRQTRKKEHPKVKIKEKRSL